MGNVKQREWGWSKYFACRAQFFYLLETEKKVNDRVCITRRKKRRWGLHSGFPSKGKKVLNRLRQRKSMLLGDRSF